MSKSENLGLRLVQEGRLFELKEFIDNGGDLRVEASRRRRSPCCLGSAVELGFHSIVQLLLQQVQWTQGELNDALERAMEMKRIDLVDMLLESGASTAAINFYDVCRTADYDLMKSMLEMGVDPTSHSNAFARALNDTKARPLLRFYRDHASNHPNLSAQISLALCDAVKQNDERWAAMLRWAGADPFCEVPYDIWDDWDFETGLSDTAAERASASGNVALLKLLKLKPSPDQAVALIERLSWCPSTEILNLLLKTLPAGHLNSPGTNSTKLIEGLT